MDTKATRISKIKGYLRLQSGPASISEIHEALVGRLGLSVSRKTVERDMYELAEGMVVSMSECSPVRFALLKPSEIELVLQVEEVTELLAGMDPNSQLAKKLKKSIEL